MSTKKDPTPSPDPTPEPEPTPTPEPTPEPEPTPTPEPTPAPAKKDDKAAAEAEYQKRLAKEKAKWEKEKDLPEIEKLKTANQELAAKVKEREISDAFSEFASDQKAKNVARLLKIYREDLEIADDGSISNLKEIFETAKTDFPEFFPPVDKGSADAGDGKQQTKLTYDQQVDAEFSKTGRKHAFKL